MWCMGNVCAPFSEGEVHRYGSQVYTVCLSAHCGDDSMCVYVGEVNTGGQPQCLRDGWLGLR